MGRGSIRLRPAVCAAGLLAIGLATAVCAHTPLAFEPNQGQSDPAIEFIARPGGDTLWLNASEMILGGGVRLRLIGATTNAPARALDPLPGRIHYLRGRDSRHWHANVPTYARVRYADVYPGIDLEYYGNQGRLEYDFIVRPTGDPAIIALEFAPAVSQLDATGDLIVPTGRGVYRVQRPVAYQATPTGRQPVEAAFQLDENQRVRFALGDYDRHQAVVIDPVFVFATYFGGGGADSFEAGIGIATDSATNTYVAGYTESVTLPVTNAFQTARRGETDGFILKLDPSGTNLLFATYLGGDDRDLIQAIAVTTNGEVFVAGETLSTNFPVVNALQSTNAGFVDAFLARLDATGTNLLFSTYLGGADEDVIFAVAAPPDGSNVCVTGFTTSTNFPVANAFQSVLAGSRDAFVACFANSNLVYASLLGGAGLEEGTGIALDAGGSAHVVGNTTSTNFPLVNALQTNLNRVAFFTAESDVFVARFDPAGSNLVFATYYGGRRDDFGTGIALAAGGAIHVVGRTLSLDFPTVAPWQGVFNDGFLGVGLGDAFVAQLGPGGTNVQFATYLGGNRDESATAVAVDGAGNVYVAGRTRSENFPLVNALQTRCRGCQFALHDAFVAKLDSAGINLLYATLLGGDGDDRAIGLALDPATNVCVTGFTDSANFPRARAWQLFRQGETDAFIAKIAEGTAHDLAVVRIRAPKRLRLPGGGAVTNLVCVEIQNRSAHDETITNLTGLVTLTVNSLGVCPAPGATPHTGRRQPVPPLTLRPKKKLRVYFDVVIACVNDGLKTRKTGNHDDYTYTAVVDHAVLDGEVDSHPEDDLCPRTGRAPFDIDPYPDGSIKDKGCGSKLPGTKVRGGDVVTDVIAP